MKTLLSFWWRLAVLFISGFLAILPVLSQEAAEITSPVIRSVRLEGTNVVVTAYVPSGVMRVTLEGRERLGPGGWEPRAVTRLDGTGGEVTIRLPRAATSEMMRVRADASDPLPASFYGGVSTFFEAAGAGAGPGAVDFRNNAGDVATPGAMPVQEQNREVVESDIWKIRGTTLYFFNQLRGLQVIDITNPDAATVRGTLELPAAGEDLYVLGDSQVVLLARNGCDYNQSEVLVVKDAGGDPSVTARLPLPGYIVESRLVGTALYVAAQAYRPVAGTTNSTWEWGTQVSSYDLSDPAAPAARSTLWYSGYGLVVQATDRLLFVVTQDPSNWWQSIIRSIDISNPDGTMHAYESIRTAGRVPDKFKLRWQEGILTTISEDWRTVAGRRLTTKLETFRLPDPRSAGPGSVVKLGELELGAGEQLHATRFDGDRVYVVTFFRIDPLWVVDLSNPASPHIAGSVNVPGWSTFIQPLGDRLVTIGIEGSRVAVSLFGVVDPAAPTLLSRVLLGHNYSFSEATWDEKAFSVLPAANLILVPFSGDTTNGYASSVQLVDLDDKTLTARGIIEHQFQPRRATLHDTRVLSISGEEFLSVDIGDRDNPLVKGSLTLAWTVDRVLLHGSFVLEIGGAQMWGSGQPVLRAASADTPNNVLGYLNLPSDLPVLGATQRGDELYVLQGQQSYSVDAAPVAQAVLSVISLSALPQFNVIGSTTTSLNSLGFGGDFQAVWPKPDTLVFSGGGFNFFWGCWDCPMPLAMDVAGAAIRGPIFWPWYGGNGGHLLAFDVHEPSAPAFASEVDLTTNEWGNFSSAFVADELVYLSHQRSLFVPLDGSGGATPAGAGGAGVVGADPAKGGDVISPPSGTWVSQTFLNVIDYGDAHQPLVRKPVNIPGQLQGLSHGGAVIYTVGTRWTTNQMDWTEYLEAGAYDGVSVHLIDALALSDSWPRTVLISDGNIYLGRVPATAGNAAVIGPVFPGGGTQQDGLLETWRLSDAGKFTRLGSVTLDSPATALALFGGLLAVNGTDRNVALFDSSNPSALRAVGKGGPAGCLWFDLNHADGALGRGLWLPLNIYGVARVSATATP